MSDNKWTKKDVLTVLAAVQTFVMALNMVIGDKRKDVRETPEIPTPPRIPPNNGFNGRPRRPNKNRNHVDRW
ncbi:MAG: hypothetical protein EBU84_09700 [Actinobacteria bacterium]|jgi:hypothetical protein|nr:hypothetical protein [Actinomycetota bacterium]